MVIFTKEYLVKFSYCYINKSYIHIFYYVRLILLILVQNIIYECLYHNNKVLIWINKRYFIFVDPGVIRCLLVFANKLKLNSLLQF